jgi:hypothetical protein
MAAVAMVTKVQKMLNSNRTTDSFETWHKNRSSLKVVLFVFKMFKMATNMKIKKIVKNSKMNRFQWKWIFTHLTHVAPYGDHFYLLWWPFWTKNGHQNTKILRFGFQHDRVKNWALIISSYVLTLFFIHTTILVLFVWGTFVALCVTVTNICCMI